MECVRKLKEYKEHVLGTDREIMDTKNHPGTDMGLWERQEPVC
jgi:hypothetical protein